MHKGFNNTDPIGNNYFSMELNMVVTANGSSDYFEAYAYMEMEILDQQVVKIYF